MLDSSEIKFVKESPWGKDAVIELTNGRFADVEKGCFFHRNVKFLIKRGKIVSMPGHDARPKNIEPDVSIDLKGKSVLPGLFNVHCHVQMVNPTLFLDFKTSIARNKYHDRQVDRNMQECLARGITNIRDAYTEDLRLNRGLIDRIQSGDLQGPRIQQAVVVGIPGGYLSPDPGGMNKILARVMGQGKVRYDDRNSGVVIFRPEAGKREIRDAVDKAIERGADIIKVGESMEKSPINSNPMIMGQDQLDYITDQARRRGKQSTIHAVSLNTFRRSVRAGFSSLAHVPRDGYIQKEDIDSFMKNGCILDPTLSVAYDMSWKIKEKSSCSGPDLLRLYQFRNDVFKGLASEFWLPRLQKHVISGINRANKGKYKMFGMVSLENLLAHFACLPLFGFENARKLFASGAILACGNDGGIQSCTPAMIGHELAMIDLFGSDSDSGRVFKGPEAVRAATINSARSMGIDGRFGSIQSGKVADLAIIEGNPFEDISVIGRPVEALFMDGRPVIDNFHIFQ